ncbi:MAG: translocation/assembly module TamB domain-containing protein, partial [Candidatus Accumulibacter sp.]|nr:translocation/assembly module TamB domain-containing protein [Accumulibacter sp.]
SDGRRHTIEDLSLAADGVSATGRATLDGRAPFALTAHAEINGALAGHALAASVDASGTLARVDLSARALQGVEGEARATLTPFAASPFSVATGELRGIAPSAWLAGAPRARLDIALRVEADENGAGKPAGNLHIVNRSPDTFDRGGVPFASATLGGAPDGDALRLAKIALILPGGGGLHGKGRLSGNVLSLDLDARGLDAARLVSRLLPTRLDGPLSLSLDAERQSVRLALREERRIRLSAEAEHANGTLTVKALELAARGARLTAAGRVETGGARAFAVQGTLRRFDPSRFARIGEARINADIEASGRLGPQPVVEGRFMLRERSRYAGLPLAGQGRASLAWPRIHELDVALSAGPNRLTAKGGFGAPDDHLSVRIDAPRLAPFGIDGALRGSIDAAGTPRHPELTLDLAASRLELPEVGALAGLTLRAKTAGWAELAGLAEKVGGGDSTLDVELALERVTRPDESGAARESARAVKARISGSARAHRLEADGELAVSARQARRLRLAVEGGFGVGWNWRGQLRELQSTRGKRGPALALDRPAPLEIAPGGWSVGPLALSGKYPEWTAELSARADASRLAAEVIASAGAESGRIEGRVEAAMRGPWQIAAADPWRGHLNLKVSDLAWFDKFFGEEYRTGGKLAGAFTLAGTPARPALQGRIDGDALSLELAEQGLRLSEGELAAEVAGGFLRIDRLGFSSALSEPPRALRDALGDDAGRFEKPGRLDVSGELRLGDGAAAENVFLDLRLDRFGAWQLPDHWIAASGDGRIAWQAGTLSITGGIGIDAAYWQLAPTGLPRLSDDVRVERPGAAADSGTPLNLDLDLKVDLGRRFLFRGAGLQTWLFGAIAINARGRDLPRASGTIRLRGGRFDAYGQQLDIARGRLTFQGLLDDPALDVRAVRRGLAVEPGVQVGGTARRPIVRLVSEPEVPDADKLSWLLLGHGQEAIGAGDAALLASAAAELLGDDSGGVLRQLKDTFGIDEFGIRQGEIGGGGGRAPASRVASRSFDAANGASDQILSVGKRLSANASLAYEQSLTKAESVVKLTFNLTRRISVIGRAGSDNALDIFYTLSFGQPPRRTEDRGRKKRTENREEIGNRQPNAP